VAGGGNNGEDGTEGCRAGRIVGTYVHGPLLPKNGWLADQLLAWALDRRGRPATLEPLDDALEALAAERAGRIARAERR
jgi:CobQ-like glutamine amidotransferase family enzyme